MFSLLGKAASEVFWWLGIGWYQFVTLISWLNVRHRYVFRKEAVTLQDLGVESMRRPGAGSQECPLPVSLGTR